MDIQSRVVNFYKSNQFIQKYVKGYNGDTNEVLLEYNGYKKIISIDQLEAIKSEQELLSLFGVAQEPVTSETNSVNASVINPVPEAQTKLVDNVDVKKETLNDIKILTELKNKEGLDNLLKKFAVNQSTGLIDINTAISIITRNTMNEVEKAINNKYDFNSDFNLYDIQGNYVGTPTTGLATEDEQIAKSFNNIKIYLEAAKMYPEQVNYNEEQIKNFMQTYISKVKEELHGVPVEQPKEPTNVETPNQIPTPTNNVQNVPNTASAGFADIFVLTVIVLVYAIIIINLILKLK